MKLSGGLDGGLEPPAFQRAEMERIRAQEAVAERSDDLESSMQLDQVEFKRRQSNVFPDAICSCSLPSLLLWHDI